MRTLDGSERLQAAQWLANYAPLERASGPSLERLLGSARYFTIEPPAHVIVEGTVPSEVFFMLKGTVRIYHRAPDGRQFTPKVMNAPNHFGDVELIGGFDTNRQSVEAMSPGTVAAVPWPVLREVLLDDHELCVGWMVGLASQFVHTIDADRHNVFVDLGGRLANTLLSYANLFGKQEGNHLALTIPLSAQRLADQVGAVRRSVTRVLKTFVDRGWIESGAGSLILKDRRALASQTLPGRLGLDHRLEHAQLISGVKPK